MLAGETSMLPRVGQDFKITKVPKMIIIEPVLRFLFCLF